MSTKKKTDAQLPPLLPLEYCSVARAARLLGCEEEDIYHWHEVGAVKLCVELDDETCRATLRPKTESFREIALFQNFSSDIELIESLDEGENFESEFCSLIGVGPMALSDPHLPPFLTYDALASGLWVVKDQLFFNGEYTLVSPTDLNHIQYEGGLRDVELARISIPDLSSERLVLKSDLEKLHRAIHGVEVLNTRYNNQEIATALRQAEQEAQSIRPPRIEKKQAHLIRLLIESHPNLGAEVIENPYAACDVLEAQFARDGIGPIDANPVTVGNWISGKRKK
ncbi:hypothetical protein [Salinivibrio kushneri]|uniref:Uncharacterized protein n=1 Tax=Salinivibrio kushneri TaxID=1908198 RepID=A0AA47LRQ0_9GAMM|nr:hypothetical protein [Salinivibrio kushneri]WBA08989.1 hypothetical protein N8M53_01820 [Salinivibrio kushneri]